MTKSMRSPVAGSAGSLAALALAVGVLVPLGATSAAAAPDGGTTLYVALDGDDANPGTLAKPLRSLEGARDAVRALKTSGALAEGGITVEMREGVYERSESFVLTAADSGTARSPITYRAYEGEEVALAGGTFLERDAFNPVEDAKVRERFGPAVREDIVQVDLSHLSDLGEIVQTGHGLPPADQLPEMFIGDEEQTLARYPDTGYVLTGEVQDPGAFPRDEAENWPTRPLPSIFDHGATFEYEDARPAQWHNTGDLWMYGYWYWDWADGNLRIEDIDQSEGRITTDTASQYSVRKGQRYYYYNVLEEITVPGEYYIDRGSQIMYLLPPRDFGTEPIGLSTLTEPLVRIDGASDVRFEGLTFELSRGDGVHVSAGERNVVSDSLFTKLGGVAARFSGGRQNGLSGSEITGTGAGGVVLGGGDRATLTAADNFVRDNVIHDFSRLYLTYHPAVQLLGVGNQVAHNEIFDGPHQAIAFQGNDHVIEYNDIHDVVLETADSGAIYSARDWSSRGTAIRYNWVHAVGGPDAPSDDQYGIYLDDMTTGIAVYGNILQDMPRSFLLGGGRANVVENNIVVDAPGGFRLDDRGQGWASAACSAGGVMRASLAQWPYQEDPWASAYPDLPTILDDSPCAPKYNSVRRNVMVDAPGFIVADAARTSGIVENNWVTTDDIGFVDRAGGDLRLRGDAPVFEQVKGFQPIPVEQFGPDRDGLELGLTGWQGAVRTTGNAHTGTSGYDPRAGESLRLDLHDPFTGVLTAWLYDDGSASARAEVDAEDVANAARSLGVDTAVSTSHYVVRLDGKAAVTSVERSVGWHKLQWSSTSDGKLRLTIDGVEVTTTDRPAIGAIRLGSPDADAPDSRIVIDDVSLLSPTVPVGASEPLPELEIGLEGWVGDANPSKEQAHTGTSSQAVKGDRSVLTWHSPEALRGSVSVWFRDDADDRSAATIANVRGESAAQWRSIGINTNQSADRYVYRVDGTWTVTDVPRTTGWHELSWQYVDDDQVRLAIDGHEVATVPASASWTTIELGDFWADDKSAAVFFDSVWASDLAAEPQVTLERTEVTVGELADAGVGVTGSGFPPGAEVTLVAADAPVDTAIVDDGGEVSFTFVSTSLTAGTHEVTLASNLVRATGSLKVMEDSDEPGGGADGDGGADGADGDDGSGDADGDGNADGAEDGTTGPGATDAGGSDGTSSGVDGSAKDPNIAGGELAATGMPTGSLVLAVLAGVVALAGGGALVRARRRGMSSS